MGELTAEARRPQSLVLYLSAFLRVSAGQKSLSTLDRETLDQIFT